VKPAIITSSHSGGLLTKTRVPSGKGGRLLKASCSVALCDGVAHGSLKRAARKFNHQCETASKVELEMHKNQNKTPKNARSTQRTSCQECHRMNALPRAQRESINEGPTLESNRGTNQWGLVKCTKVSATNLWASILNQPAQIGYASKRTEADYGSVHEQKEILSKKRRKDSCCHIIWLFCLHTLKLKPPSQGQIYILYIYYYIF
jgi:hypothetical protein